MTANGPPRRPAKGLVQAEQQQRARMAAISERNRIARELHDIVAHSLSVIVVQAEGGRALAARRPEARAGGVRHDRRDQPARRWRRPAASSGCCAARPGRRHADVRADARAGRHRRPGPPDQRRVRAQRLRRAAAGEPAVGLTAYRVVQESLTNVLKHGGPGARARVTVAYTADAIEIEIADDGVAAAGRGPGGHGQAGCGSGWRCYDGTLAAGPRTGGGFLVRARLPTALDGGRRQVTHRRVFLVDDQALVRSGFRMLLEAEDDLEVVGEAGDGATAVERLARTPGRRGADGHPDAADGRRRGDPAADRGREPGPGAGADHLRPRRVRLRRAPGGRGRVPAQGRPAGRAVVGHPQRGRRRRRGGAQCDPPAAGPRRAASRPAGRRRRSGPAASGADRPRDRRAAGDRRRRDQRRDRRASSTWPRAR